MKKLAYLFLAFAALVAGLSACETKEEEAVTLDSVDLRYRVNDVYNLEASDPAPFTIVVKSTKPWTIRSYHPDWCIIDKEEGEAVADSLVHVGKGENTTVRVQYYDNTDLDDRTDIIEIASAGWIGKKVTINQKGCAYLTVPDDELSCILPKPATDTLFNVRSNQPWSASVTEISGQWLTITEGATGEKNGVVRVHAEENTGEMRYATVTVFDRNGVKSAEIHYTQDGIQLEPNPDDLAGESHDELRVEWNQEEAGFSVKSNTKWEVVKKDGPNADPWYTILTPNNQNDGVVRISFQPNTTVGIRSSYIVLRTVPSGDEPPVVREIWVRQGNENAPVRYAFDADEIALWHVTASAGKWTGTPVAVDNGMKLENPTQIKRTLPLSGIYTFHWTDIGDGTTCILWYVFKGSKEFKYTLLDGTAKVSGEGPISGSTEYGVAASHEMTIKVSPVSGGYCNLAFFVDGVEFVNGNSSETVFPTCTWGADIDLYLGVNTGTSATLEWYEYTAPFNWGD